MLPSSITLGTAGSSVVFEYHETVGGDKLVYHGPNHSDRRRQTLEFIRTAPKRSGVNYGTRRGFIRKTTDVDVTNADGSTAMSPSVSTLGINWPVGVDNAEDLVRGEIYALFSVLQIGMTNPLDFFDNNASETELDTIVAFFTEGSLR